MTSKRKPGAGAKAAEQKKESKSTTPPNDPAKTAYEQLSPAHQHFVDEYILDFNGTRSYLAVPGTDCTEKAAGVAATRLLGKSSIQRAIQERIVASGRRAGLEITKERILQELARLAFFDIRKLYNDDGSMKAPHELDDDTAAALSSIETAELTAGEGVVVGHVKKPRAADKKASLELLMKHMGMLVEKVEVDATAEIKALLGAISGSALPVRAKPDDD